MVLHGGPGGRICGYSRLDILGSERPVVRYDQLGSGRSGRPNDLSIHGAARWQLPMSWKKVPTGSYPSFSLRRF
jgi:pimeloyl-ACP methyl ester carboxylesterase